MTPGPGEATSQTTPESVARSCSLMLRVGQQQLSADRNLGRPEQNPPTQSSRCIMSPPKMMADASEMGGKRADAQPIRQCSPLSGTRRHVTADKDVSKLDALTSRVQVAWPGLGRACRTWHGPHEHRHWRMSQPSMNTRPRRSPVLQVRSLHPKPPSHQNPRQTASPPTNIIVTAAHIAHFLGIYITRHSQASIN